MRRQPDRHRLQVRRKARERQRRHVDRLGPFVLDDAESVVILRDGRARIVQFVQHQLQVLRIDATHRDVSAGHRRGNTPRRGDDAVTDHPVLGGMQAVDPVDGHCRRPRPRNLGAHLVEHRAQVNDVGLARRVVDRRNAFSDDGGHQDVLGGTHGRELELNLGPPQVICFGDDAAVFDVAPGAELTQTGLVHVQRSRSDRVAARQGNLGALTAPDQRAQNADRRAELSNRSEIGVVLGFVGRGHPHHVAIEFDCRAQPPKYLGHQWYVQDVWAVGDRAGALRQKARRHQLQYAVLGPPDGNFAR